MSIKYLEGLWAKALQDLLNGKLPGNALNILAKQSYDSIRRIEIYKVYKLRAEKAVEENKIYFHTSNPYVLAQRSDLDRANKIWIIFLATYFGKSQKSGWNLFIRATFDLNKKLITFNQIKDDPQKYFNFLESFDFFENSQFANHRKYTKKALTGKQGLFQSMEHVLNNMENYCKTEIILFHDMYKMAGRIPNFGRLASFDFTSSLVKCGLNVREPQSMYADHSTGPSQALALLLRLTNSNNSVQTQKILGERLVKWFNENSNIFMVSQILEDAICNWQKNPEKYIYYSG